MTRGVSHFVIDMLYVVEEKTSRWGRRKRYLPRTMWAPWAQAYTPECKIACRRGSSKKLVRPSQEPQATVSKKIAFWLWVGRQKNALSIRRLLEEDRMRWKTQGRQWDCLEGMSKEVYH